MGIQINLRHLEENDLHLAGEIPVAELDLDVIDEMIHLSRPLLFDLTAQRLERSVLVQGRLRLDLDCECVRCLKPFQHRIDLRQWACHLALEGEEKVAVVNDLVDLTPQIREDIVLAFPQHPLCGPECTGLAPLQNSTGEAADSARKEGPSPWTALDQLKL